MGKQRLQDFVHNRSALDATSTKLKLYTDESVGSLRQMLKVTQLIVDKHLKGALLLKMPEKKTQTLMFSNSSDKSNTIGCLFIEDLIYPTYLCNSQYIAICLSTYA